MENYTEVVLRSLWSYADRHHDGELDDGERQRRPPVFAPDFASNNVLVPPTGTNASEIRSAIPIRQRHKWFRSFRSSQALTQSVFAAIHAFDRLDLLEDVAAECGLSAFFNDKQDWTMSLEHKVRGLNEPRPTDVDVLLRRLDQRVAIECKFLEDEFGLCSRTSQKRYPDPKQHCDGNYRFQNGRRHRCALTEIGIRYWEHLPHLFKWASDQDHAPCPFGATYQLARNALAATVTTRGDLKPTKGHVLVIYDARNPAFGPGGKANEQWQHVVGACLHQGLFRLLSWQSLLMSLAKASEFAYLVDSLGAKYGLEPN